MKKSRTTKPVKLMTSYPAVTMSQAHDAFVESQRQNDDTSGANNYLAEFSATVDRVMQIMPTFSVHDVISNSRAFEIPTEIVKQMFATWSEKMVQLGRLEVVSGAYDFPIFIRV